VRGRYFFIVLAVGFVAAGIASKVWFFAVFGAVFFGGLAAGMAWVEKRYMSTNPVLTALIERPDEIVKVRHIETSDTRRLFVTHWVHVFARDHKKPLGFRVPEERIAEFAHMLARRCPAADVDVPGFKRPVVGS